MALLAFHRFCNWIGFYLSTLVCVSCLDLQDHFIFLCCMIQYFHWLTCMWNNLHLILIPSFLFLSFFSLKPLDIEFMKRLHDKVNVIPLIAKADTLTPEECQLFKKQVRLSVSATLAIKGVRCQKNNSFKDCFYHTVWKQGVSLGKRTQAINKIYFFLFIFLIKLVILIEQMIKLLTCVKSNH